MGLDSQLRGLILTIYEVGGELARHIRLFADWLSKTNLAKELDGK